MSIKINLKTILEFLFYFQKKECNNMLITKNLRENKQIRNIQMLNPIIVVVELFKIDFLKWMINL